MNFDCRNIPISVIDSEKGFFWNLRQGNFDKVRGHRALSKIAAVPSLLDQPIPARFVSVLWYVPIFMQWQLDRVGKDGGDIAQYKAAINKFTSEIERVLGIP